MEREIELKIELNESDHHALLDVAELIELEVVYHQVYMPEDEPNHILRIQICEEKYGKFLTKYIYGYKERETQEGLEYMDREEFGVEIPETLFNLLQATQKEPEIQYKTTCQFARIPGFNIPIRIDRIILAGAPDMFEMEVEIPSERDGGFTINMVESFIKMFLSKYDIPYKKIQTPKYRRVWNAMHDTTNIISNGR